ncbi:MAG: HNH endonuclease family protein [Methylobacter sp.]|nr:HNH endonuclease family protein [Methylobacter sp.]
MTITSSLPAAFSSTLAQTVTYKIARAMILLHAYLNPNQNDLIDRKFEIEHIFPRVWQTGNYHGWNHEEAKEYLERYGNKVAITKKMNIHAGNGYFGQKKIKYSLSPIANVKDLANHSSNDWTKKDIEAREEAFLAAIVRFFQMNLPSSAGKVTSSSFN